MEGDLEIMSFISNVTTKIRSFFELLFKPYQIGFVQPHSYLSDEQTYDLKKVLESENGEYIITTYEGQMLQAIGQGYGMSFAAARMAFYASLKAMGISDGDEVILPGFTCSVMPNAILKTGAKPVFSDIDENTFGSCADSIKKCITPQTKAVVAQHSFGIPCNIEEIASMCREKGVMLIEDCAIAFDSTVNGIKVGNWGDVAIFSTDHSKPMNTIIGGFLYIREKSFYDKIRPIYETMPELDTFHQKRLYERFLFERKHFIPNKYPRSLLISHMHYLVKKYGSNRSEFTFLENDYTKPQKFPSTDSSPYPYPAKMPKFLAKLGLMELDRWEHEKKRRKSILKFYIEEMKRIGLGKYIPDIYSDPNIDIVPLRFVFTHPQAHRIKIQMARYIDINWTWFCQPIICCPNGPEDLGYVSGTCIAGERTGDLIVNWPCALPVGWDAKVQGIFIKVMSGVK